MSCLFYCIRRHPGELPKDMLGVGGSPVYQVAHVGLSAALSQIGPADLNPDIPRVRAYERVVRSCHHRGAVVPMRYGCVVEGESQAIQLLEEHGPRYESLLREVDGCVEMGLRVLLPSELWAVVLPGGPAGSREGAEPGPGEPAVRQERMGLAYLTARKAHYASQDRWTGEYRQAAERCREYFTGLYVKYTMEAPSPRLPLLSLYFLVPRPVLKSFRQAFRRLTTREPARLMLSGPWPPYNFCNEPFPGGIISPGGRRGHSYGPSGKLAG